VWGGVGRRDGGSNGRRRWVVSRQWETSKCDFSDGHVITRRSKHQLEAPASIDTTWVAGSAVCVRRGMPS
jgi:hypothetical protein